MTLPRAFHEKDLRALIDAFKAGLVLLTGRGGAAVKLFGYVRKEGAVGFRNHVLVVPLTGCLQFLAWRIAVGIAGD